MRVTVDFRFVEIEYEIEALGAFLDTMERELPILRDRSRQHAEESRNKMAVVDEADVEVHYQRLSDLERNILPRFLRGSILVALWAIYESAVLEVAEYVRKAKEIPEGIDHKRGSFLKKVEKCFHDTIGMPLFAGNGENKDHLRLLQDLRNAIAHANGRFDAMNKTTFNRITQWARTNC